MKEHRKGQRSSVDEFLSSLEEMFEKVRVKVEPRYPYDKITNTVTLPPELEKELRLFVLTGNKVEAVKRVTVLTGAGLRVSKDYVDGLVEIRRRGR